MMEQADYSVRSWSESVRTRELRLRCYPDGIHPMNKHQTARSK